jgi:hypothetical protein
MTLRFTVQDNFVTSVSCGTSDTLTFLNPPSVSNGEFSFTGDDGAGFPAGSFRPLWRLEESP